MVIFDPLSYKVSAADKLLKTPKSEIIQSRDADVLLLTVLSTPKNTTLLIFWLSCNALLKLCNE